jgi:protocatechuate 3,4-dioxygenase beta subunit
MDRRFFLGTLTLVLAVLVVRPRGAASQDLEYMRAFERAQRDRPAVLGTRGRIAPEGEPGTPLVIHGRVFGRDGRTPAPDVVVFAYHTDATGHYDVESAGPHSWRLRGWVKTDSDGRFEFETIRPAPYPNRSTAAHVHLAIETTGVPRQDAGLLFEDDSLLTPSERAQSKKAGKFGTVRSVDNRSGVQHVSLHLRLK